MASDIRLIISNSSLSIFTFTIYIIYSVFFFQAEDGIRDVAVTGVQTCALPIYAERERRVVVEEERRHVIVEDEDHYVGLLVVDPLLKRLVVPEDWRPGGVVAFEIGRASCRERG